MTRLQHVHARVRQGIGHRKPVAQNPAFRLTALMTGLAIATTTLAVTSTRASAAERGPARRPAPAPEATLARAVLARTAPVAAHGTPPLLPARDVPQKTTPPDAAAGNAASPGAAQVAAAQRVPESRRLEHGFAEDVLRANGIRRRSTGGCSDRTVTTCTSFERIRWGTIRGLIDFAESSGCEITVTGGTERGHASGTYSHWNGYKADIAPGRCVDRAVERYPSAGVRGDGARLYRSPDGALFAREKDHWDITFR